MSNLTCIWEDVTRVLVEPGFVGIDLEDVRWVMNDTGRKTFGTSESGGKMRAKMAVDGAMRDMGVVRSANASSALVTIIGPLQMKMAEVNHAMDAVRLRMNCSKDIIFAGVVDPSLVRNIRVSIIASGLSGL